MRRPVLPFGLLTLKSEINTRNLKLKLKDLSKLRAQDYIHVSFSANMVLMSQNTLRADARRQKFHDAITAALSTGAATLTKFVESNVIIRDLLLDALRHDPEYQVLPIFLVFIQWKLLICMVVDRRDGDVLDEDLPGDSSSQRIYLRQQPHGGDWTASAYSKCSIDRFRLRQRTVGEVRLHDQEGCQWWAEQ
jgi:hypothetical protein